MLRYGLAARSALGYGLGVSAPGGAAPNGLLNNLIAYWKLDEASGDALDAHTNGLTLTDTNTVTNAAGKVYATARQYTRANNERHRRIADDALLSAGDVELTIACWCNLDSKPAQIGMVSKFGGAGEYGYALIYDNALDRFTLYISSNGTLLNYVKADALGSPSSSVWYFLVAWHDPTTNTISIQIDNGTVNSVAHTTGIFDNTYPLWIGGWLGTGYFNGRIGPVAMWKSAAGGGGVLSAAQRSALWAGGAGLAYANFTT